MGSTWKTLKDLTFKPGSSQNGRFREETGGRELPSQNESLPFKTGELEHMNYPCKRSNQEMYKFGRLLAKFSTKHGIMLLQFISFIWKVRHKNFWKKKEKGHLKSFQIWSFFGGLLLPPWGWQNYRKKLNKLFSLKFSLKKETASFQHKILLNLRFCYNLLYIKEYEAAGLW